MSRTRGLIALLGLMAIFSKPIENAYLYLFQPRISVSVTCFLGRCAASYAHHYLSYVNDRELTSLTTGQVVRVYEVDQYNVHLDNGQPPWTVWIFAALILAYLIAVAVGVTQATADRRAALARGEQPHHRAEPAVLAWRLGVPLIVIGALLSRGEYSRTVGLLTLAAGVVVLVGFSALWFALLPRRPAPANPTPSAPVSWPANGVLPG